MKKPGKSLIVPRAGALAEFDAASAQARAYRVEARSANTRRAYARWWDDYGAWCDSVGRPAVVMMGDGTKPKQLRSYQHTAIETIAGYLGHLANGRGSGKPMAKSTIGQALAALQLAFRMAADGNPKVVPVDFASPRLREVAQGIRNAIAKERTVKKAAPLLNDDMRDLLDKLSPDKPREARDAAILALGWAGARRRSELAGLDWEKLGDGTGYVTIDDKGITITMMVGKTHQDEAMVVVVPRGAMPTACTRLEEWVALAKIAAGTPLFRQIRGLAFNEKKQAKTATGYRGVSFHKASGKWQARVAMPDGKEKFLGLHDSPEAAHMAFCEERARLKITTAGAGEVLRDRFGAGSISAMIKARMAQILATRAGKKKATRADKNALSLRYSGHSMRAGFITAAAERGVPAEIIMTQSGHKSHSQVAGYIRIADKWRKNALNGVGF